MNREDCDALYAEYKGQCNQLKEKAVELNLFHGDMKKYIQKLLEYIDISPESISPEHLQNVKLMSTFMEPCAELRFEHFEKCVEPHIRPNRSRWLIQSDIRHKMARDEYQNAYMKYEEMLDASALVAKEKEDAYRASMESARVAMDSAKRIRENLQRTVDDQYRRFMKQMKMVDPKAHENVRIVDGTVHWVPFPRISLTFNTFSSMLLAARASPDIMYPLFTFMNYLEAFPELPKTSIEDIIRYVKALGKFPRVENLLKTPKFQNIFHSILLDDPGRMETALEHLEWMFATDVVTAAALMKVNDRVDARNSHVVRKRTTLHEIARHSDTHLIKYVFLSVCVAFSIHIQNTGPLFERNKMQSLIFAEDEAQKAFQSIQSLPGEIIVQRTVEMEAGLADPAATDYVELFARIPRIADEMSVESYIIPCQVKEMEESLQIEIKSEYTAHLQFSRVVFIAGKCMRKIEKVRQLSTFTLLDTRIQGVSKFIRMYHVIKSTFLDKNQVQWSIV